MVDISIKTVLEELMCIAELRYIKPDGKEHKRRYNCVRLEADSVHRAELKALIVGLREIRCPARVTAYLKTSHSIAAINQDWARNWKKNGWKNQKGKLVRDWELWKEIYDIADAKGIILSGGGYYDNMGNADKEIP